MKKYFTLFSIYTLVVTSLILFGCKKEDDNSTNSKIPGAIKGRVTDKEENTSIVGAAIVTNPVTTYFVMTDDNGTFKITNVKAGSYTVTVTKTGYLTQSKKISVNGGDTAAANFSLLPPALSSGGARIDCNADGIQWSSYTTSGSCTKKQDTIIISSSFSLYSNTYSITIFMLGVTAVDTITLGPSSNNYIEYRRSIQGYTETYTTKRSGGSGTLIITYFNSSEKTMKGTFYGTATNGSFDKDITGGTFRGLWQ